MTSPPSACGRAAPRTHQFWTRSLENISNTRPLLPLSKYAARRLRSTRVAWKSMLGALLILSMLFVLTPNNARAGNELTLDSGTMSMQRPGDHQPAVAQPVKSASLASSRNQSNAAVPKQDAVYSPKTLRNGTIPKPSASPTEARRMSVIMSVTLPWSPR